jgi:cell division protein FtsW (lipid II flippase)
VCVFFFVCFVAVVVVCVFFFKMIKRFWMGYCHYLPQEDRIHVYVSPEQKKTNNINI